MVAAARIAVHCGILKKPDAIRIESLIRALGLPVRIRGLVFEALRGSYRHDKKFIRGTNRLVLPSRIGSVKIVDGVSDAAIKKAIEEIS